MSSRFEFLGNTTIGQYLPKNSWFHKRDPRARLITFMMLFLAITFVNNILGLAFGFTATLTIFLVAGLPLKPAWQGVKRALPFIFILGIIQILFSNRFGDERVVAIILNIEITHQGIMSAAMLILKFIVLVTLLNALVMSLSTAQITAALFYLLKPFEKLGFPVNDLTMVIQITLRYLPLIAQIAEKIAKAQAARGGDWEQHSFNPIRQAKRVVPLIVPLMVNSLKRSETMAVAMESRGFTAAKQRSSFYALQFTWRDLLLLIFFGLLSGLMLISGTYF